MASTAAEGRAVPGSGNRWDRKGDCNLGPFLLSAKAEANRTWASTRRQLREALEMALGTGLLPGLAILDDDEEEIVVLRLSDLLAALDSGATLTKTSNGGETRRELAQTPAMLRE